MGGEAFAAPLSLRAARTQVESIDLRVIFIRGLLFMRLHDLRLNRALFLHLSLLLSSPLSLQLPLSLPPSLVHCLHLPAFHQGFSVERKRLP